MMLKSVIVYNSFSSEQQSSSKRENAVNEENIKEYCI